MGSVLGRYGGYPERDIVLGRGGPDAAQHERQCAGFVVGLGVLVYLVLGIVDVWVLARLVEHHGIAGLGVDAGFRLHHGYMGEKGNERGMQIVAHHKGWRRGQ